MKKLFLLVCMTCVLALPVQAQQWSAEQTEIWNTVSKQWELEMAEDKAWIDMLHAAFQSWPNESLMPLGKADTVRFHAADAGQFKIVVQHIAPVGIVVVGDTALAHYNHMTTVEYQDGERESFDGRFTDILIRSGNGWQFIGWVGEEEPEGS